MSQLRRTITYFGQTRVMACDGRCEKAWGTSTRPCEQLDPDNVEDYAWLSDGELGEAPEDPGTYEGDHPKPSEDQKLESKWCARQCERSTMVVPGEDVVLRDFSRRFYNKAPHTRETAIKDAPLDERIKAIVIDFVPRLQELTPDDRLSILIPMIIAQVRISPNSVREWGRVLSLMLEKEPDQVVILCSNLTAKVAKKHGVMPELERIVDVAAGLEAHVLAGLERGMQASD